MRRSDALSIRDLKKELEKEMDEKPLRAHYRGNVYVRRAGHAVWL